MRKLNIRALRPTPALVVAFVALFATMGGIGYSAVKLKPSSIKTKNIKTGAVTTDKLADGAVTTPKFAPDAVAPNATYAKNAANATNATNATNAANAMRLGGAAPGQCQTGWLEASMVVDTSTLTADQPDGVVPGFNCASKAVDAIQIHREATGLYTVSLAGVDSGTAVSSSAGANAVTAASKITGGELTVKVWNNGDAAFVDGKTFSLIAF
jgi:trimeric autotransporter adhesin